MQWLWVGILGGRALRKRQCTLEREAWQVNVWGTLIIKIDQSETTKSRMFNT